VLSQIIQQVRCRCRRAPIQTAFPIRGLFMFVPADGDTSTRSGAPCLYANPASATRTNGFYSDHAVPSQSYATKHKRFCFLSSWSDSRRTPFVSSNRAVAAGRTWIEKSRDGHPSLRTVSTRQSTTQTHDIQHHYTERRYHHIRLDFIGPLPPSSGYYSRYGCYGLASRIV